MRSFIRFVVLLASLGMSVSRAGTGFQHFISRDGDRLMDGTNEFRFMGANMPGLVLPYDWTLALPDRMHLPSAWEQEDGFKTLDQMNLRVVRTWNLPMRKPDEPRKSWHYVLAPGEFNEEAFKVADSLFALANKYGVRVIFDLTADSGDYLGGIGTYAAHRNKKRAEFWTDPQLKEDYRATVRHVLNRTNTLTGIAYRDDRAVLAWQFGNEMHTATFPWLSEMAAFIKTIDTNHLVSETRHRPGQPLDLDPNIDLYTRHLYGNYPGIDGGWTDAIRRDKEKLKGQRPLYVGEFGPYIDGKMFTHENVEAKTKKFLDDMIAEPGICGAMIWSMYFHHQDGGCYWHQIMTYPAVWSYHWPGFPSANAQRESGIMSAMRSAAFTIQHLPVPPVPVPDAPELLPFAGAPVFSWRGSAGASGYDIERAPQPAGPWTTLATNISDADTAYRPLYSDATASPGDSWCYRVTARNADGASRPSNIVGPVAMKSICLVDEMQDFTRCSAKTTTLKLNNDYNALYAEYLFRASGITNDWIEYTTPAPIHHARIVAFYAKDPADLTFEIHDGGKDYVALHPEKTITVLPKITGGAASGQNRTMVDYTIALPPQQKQLHIRWHGHAELDRVELWQQ